MKIQPLNANYVGTTAKTIAESAGKQDKLLRIVEKVSWLQLARTVNSPTATECMLVQTFCS